MAEGAGWKEWIDGPMGYALRGATYGGALGYLYDKMRDKKNKGSDTLRRIATGALIGSLSGSAISSPLFERKKADTRNLLNILDAIQKGRKMSGNAGKEEK